MTIKAHVSETKKKTLSELISLINSKNTILIASIKNIPASQFQEIGKKLRSKAVIKVPKKNLILRALESSNNEELKRIKEKINEDAAVLFSDLDSFELASELIENKKPAKAKIGQESPEDIEVPAGPTDLVPGPAISELGALGIKIQIEGGKISIKEPKIIVKKGSKISGNSADIMNKLNIKPFFVSFVPLAAFDRKEGKLYLSININKEETLTNLKTAFSKSTAFAVEIGYACRDTIKFLLERAGRHGKVIEALANKSSNSQDTPNKSGEEK